MEERERERELEEVYLNTRGMVRKRSKFEFKLRPISRLSQNI